MLFTELEYGVSSYAFKNENDFSIIFKKRFHKFTMLQDDTKEALKRFLL